MNAYEKPAVLLIGEGITALTALRSLLTRCRVAAIVRKAAFAATDPVHVLAYEEEIPTYDVSRPSELADLVKAIQPDAVVISSFHHILPAETLSLSRFVNVHYSPLPRYRGRANVNWAIINGEPSAAISIHMITPGLDSGNLLYQEEIPIRLNDTAGTLYAQLNAIQERELAGAVLRMLAGDPGRPQDHERATYGCARVPGDGEIDWKASTVGIDRLIRGLSPFPLFPGAFTFFDMRRWIVTQAQPAPGAPAYEGRVPGRVVGRSAKSGWVDVLTGDGILRLMEMAEPSGRTFHPATLISSTRDTLGISVADLLTRIEIFSTTKS
ncbi:MAG TPA: methionyl-tRNA formyltransferase [Chthoniobacterales bacterium]